MSPAHLDSPPNSPAPKWRSGLLTTVATVLTLAGMVLAVARPPWLIDVLQMAVQSAGTAAPLMFVLLCALATPLHLNGVLVAISAVLWPLPVALGLSFAGSLLGCALTVALLWRLGGVALRQRDAWPAWLRKLSAHVTRRPLATGLAVRVALGSGMALEAFYLITGYTRRQYLIVTIAGIAVWVTQALVGVTVLHTLLQISPWLAVAAAVVPALALASGMALYSQRKGAL